MEVNHVVAVPITIAILLITPSIAVTVVRVVNFGITITENAIHIVIISFIISSICGRTNL